MSATIEYAQLIQAIDDTIIVTDVNGVIRDETERFQEEHTLRKRLAELEAQPAK